MSLTKHLGVPADEWRELDAWQEAEKEAQWMELSNEEQSEYNEREFPDLANPCDYAGHEGCEECRK